MMNLFKNSKGFSLPELLVAVGISGIVALAASKMMSDSFKNQSYIETMAEIGKASAIAQNNLANKKNCDFFFTAFPANQSFASPGVSVTGIKIPAGGSTTSFVTPIKVGDYGKYKIDKIEVVDSASSARIKDVVLTFIWNGRPFLSTATIEKRISVFAEIDYGQNGTLDTTDTWKCGGVVRDSKLDSQKALCDSLGTEFAVWGTPLAGQCNIKQFKCPAGQIPFALSSLGKVICKNTQNALDLWALTDTAPVACPAATSNIKIVFSGGRYHLVCGGGCTPTNSTWGAWSAWSTCSGGLQTRTKPCTGSVTCGGSNNCTGCSGGSCPSTTTETQTCSCVANGQYCSSSNICGDNDCADCCTATTPNCSANSGMQGICGGTLSCTGGGNCL